VPVVGPRSHAQRKVALSLRGESAAEDQSAHPEAVGVTWAVSFQQVEQRSPAAVELLRLCAYLAPEGIPEALIKEGGDNLPSAVRAAVSDLVSWNTALSALRRFSLVDRQAETGTLSLHQLVQVVVQEAQPEAEQRAWVTRVVRLVSAAFPLVEFANWERCERLVPHALVCADQIEEWQIVSQEAARLLNQAGYYLHERARYAQALPLSQRALSIWEQTLGPAHPNVATSLNNLAILYRAQGQYAEALPLSQRALSIWEQALGPAHPNVAASLNNLALLYSDQGQYAEALPLSQRALSIREQALGPAHPNVATSLFNLGGLYRDQGQYAEALPLYQRVLTIDEQAYGSTHPEVATDLEGLAALLRAMQQPEEAAKLEARAQAIRATRR
jgi:tetratricopeptide (TPR) repeat protein